MYVGEQSARWECRCRALRDSCSKAGARSAVQPLSPSHVPEIGATSKSILRLAKHSQPWFLLQTESHYYASFLRTLTIWNRHRGQSITVHARSLDTVRLLLAEPEDATTSTAHTIRNGRAYLPQRHGYEIEEVRPRCWPHLWHLCRHEHRWARDWHVGSHCG